MDMAALTTAFVQLAHVWLVAGAVALARSMGMVMLTPAFTRLGLTGMIRSAIAVVISLPVIPPVHHALTGGGMPGGFVIVATLLRELAVGGLIGLVFGAPFWAAEVAGDLVDLQRGSTMAQLVDPTSANESSIMATLMTISLVVLFFMSGGFMVLLDGLYHSYEIWPVDRFRPVLTADAIPLVLGLLDRIMRTAMLIIAPIVIALLVAEILLALLARMAPQLHIFDLSLAVKNLLFAVLILIYVTFLTPLLLNEMGGLQGSLDVLRVIGGAAPPPR